MAPRTGERYQTPIPKRDIEARSTGSGPVVSYYLNEEELERMREKDGPACGLTKQTLIEAIAAGETLSSIERAWGMKYNTIHGWVKRWDLKGINAEKAQSLLDVSVPPAAPVTGLVALNAQREPEALSSPLPNRAQALAEALANERVAREQDNTTSACIIAAEAELQREKDAEIQRLRIVLAETIGEKNKLSDANAVLEEERMQLLQTIERAATPDTFATETKADERLPYSRRSLRTDLVGPSEDIVDELAALITYIRAGNGKQFYLDLQLGEVESK